MLGIKKLLMYFNGIKHLTQGTGYNRRFLKPDYFCVHSNSLLENKLLVVVL